MAQKIRVLLIFEILGRPPEHIKKSLDDFVSTLGDKKGIELVCKTIHEPKSVEDENSKDLSTTFAEVEVLLDNLNLLFSIVLNMLPSSIEIIQPEELRLSNFELNSVISELAVKLHKYDEIAKTISIENTNLVNQITAIQQRMQGIIPQNITFTTGSKEPEDEKKNKKKTTKAEAKAKKTKKK